MSKNYIGGATATAVLSLSALSASAATDPVAALGQQVQALQETLAQQQRLLEQQAAEIRQLREQLDTVKPTAAAAVPPPKPAQEVGSVAMNGARPTITSADGRFTFAPRAIVHFDMADHHEGREGDLANDFRRGSVGGAGNRESNAARDLSDGAFFRRARLGFEGMIARDFNYRVLLDLGGSGTEGPTRINDAWISYTGFAPFTLQLGAFAPPANMDDSTSVDSIAFIERASAAEISRAFAAADGRIGLGIRGNGKRWMGAFTLTNRTVNDAEAFDTQLAAVARAGMLVATSPDYNVHAGFSGSWVFEPNDLGAGGAARTPLRLRDRPEVRADSTRLIDTGSIDADSGYVAGVEFGANWQSFYVQAENFWYGFERPESSPLSDPSFGGYYAQTSWLLTGESRRYDIATGAFQAPRPAKPFTASGGVGAWEIAVRYSHTDLNYHEGLMGTAALTDAIRGGEQNIWTLGINWYINSNLRFLFNYLRIDVDRLNPAGPGNLTPFGAAPLTPPIGVQIGQELDVYALRSQFSF